MSSSPASPDPANSSASPFASVDEMLVRLQSPLTARELWKVASRVGMSAEQFERLSGVSPHRLRRGRGGEEAVDEAKNASFLRIGRLYKRVLALCNQDEGAARAWFNSPAPLLKNKKPIEAAETAPGAKNVDGLVTQLEKAAGLAK